MKPSLAKLNRSLARQWHPKKNSPLTPRDVTPGSGKKVWWRCAKGHEWAAEIINRTNGTGCPFCAGRKVADDNCLKIINPVLAREWHPKKNQPLTPKGVTAISGKKVWWLCRKDHEWKAAISNRSYGTGCPFCSGRNATPGKCLQTKNPSLAKEWHTTRNSSLTPRNVTPYSHKKVWWKCKNGHEWQATIADRSRGSGCTVCSGRKVTNKNCLQTVNKKLAGEWHPNRNGARTPKDVLPHSNKKAWWKCGKGHEWQAIINNRMSLGRGCPYCGRHRATKETCLQTVNSRVAAEWHPEKNAPLTPSDVNATSSKEVAWKCRKGHEARERVIDRSRRGGCAICILKARAPRLFETT